MDVLTTAAQQFTTAFTGYYGQLLTWGQDLFFLLLTINIVLIAMWYAFDSESLKDSMGKFLKRYFVIGIFYTIMMNHSWLLQLLQSSEYMGSTLTHLPIDPSSIISTGTKIATAVMEPVPSFNLIHITFGAIIILITYVVIMYVFISIALELALTLILATCWIVFSGFFLAFAALESTQSIARTCLEKLLYNCIKLLGIYAVVGAGNTTISTITSAIPTSMGAYDPYWWLLSTVILFYLVAKNLPDQLASVVSHLMTTQGASLASMVSTTASMAISSATNTVSTASTATRSTISAGQLALQGVKSLGSGIVGITKSISNRMGGSSSNSEISGQSDSIVDRNNKTPGNDSLNKGVTTPPSSPSSTVKK